MQVNYAYNTAGNLHTITYPDGGVTMHLYNFMDQPTLSTYSEDGQSFNEKTEYAYDEYGRLASAKEYRNITENDYIENRYSYDNLDRVVEEVQMADKAHDGVPVGYTYNYAGQVSEVRHPDKTSELVTGYEYDVYGRIQTIRYDGEEVAWYGYTQSGLLATITTDLIVGSGSLVNTRNYTYNSAGLISQIDYKNHNGAEKEVHKYTYDARGNIATYESINAYGTTQRLLRTYQYNDRNMVAREDEENVPTGYVFSRTYEYDGAGNRVRIGKWHTGEIWRHFTYTYNGANQLLAYTYENTGEEWEKYTYNVKGQLIRVKDLRVSNPYVYYNTYDSKGQLAWTEGGGVRNRYYYDHTGMRVRKKVTVDSTDKTTDYIYRGSGLLYTEDKSNGSRYENLLDPSGTVLGGRRSGHHYIFYHQDILGSTTTILDDEGVMKNRYEYTPDGEVQSKTSTTPNEIQFTGHVQDESTGFTYMNARYYEPVTARFLTPDTYTGNPYNPNTQNVYSYTGNNPVNYVDPTGHRPIISQEDERGISHDASLYMKGMLPPPVTSGQIEGTGNIAQSVTIPEGKGTTISYMGYHKITAKSSAQYKLREHARSNNRYSIKQPEYYALIDDRIVIATKPNIGGNFEVSVGDYLDVEFQNADGSISVYKCIVGDLKGADAPNPWGHYDGKGVVEIIYHDYSPPAGYNANANNPWGKGRVISISQVGKYS